MSTLPSDLVSIAKSLIFLVSTCHSITGFLFLWQGLPCSAQAGWPYDMLMSFFRHHNVHLPSTNTHSL
ncbi:hypothetical protein HYPSUDRAFT_396312 [Hypholoma sublateritium FD-334 SS-4]|uniref:Uncharacterized protein n=1 Tax=Hypholoma sublateritium (strain FD-334 SS-4) TaxID=945553 RepID=A0A0D2KKS9_HYPSF|nr:hypothetical protein HYPSUDRAFT_396312 [Hypholoma sublateritium FD-334 SS-4]